MYSVRFASRRVAVLFQETVLPQRKWPRPRKPTGYLDSAADMAVALGARAVTPVDAPDPSLDSDWAFPDTEAGVRAALERGADTLWLNTVLWESHPVTRFQGQGLRLVSQHWRRHLLYDDKWAMRGLLQQVLSEYPSVELPSAFLLWRQGASASAAAAAGTEEVVVLPSDAQAMEEAVAARGMQFPVVLKPVFGRGSEGVQVCEDGAAAWLHAQFLLTTTRRFGPAIVVEEFLGGQEVTVAVVPKELANTLGVEGCALAPSSLRHVALPLVEREGHEDGVMPYNGAVPVAKNSKPLRFGEIPPYGTRWELCRACEDLAEELAALAPIRIDARRNAHGQFGIFDVNMKPNATGPVRPGREDQASLLTLALQGAFPDASPQETFTALVNAAADCAWSMDHAGEQPLLHKWIPSDDLIHHQEEEEKGGGGGEVEVEGGGGGGGDEVEEDNNLRVGRR